MHQRLRLILVLITVLILTACGSAPKRDSSAAAPVAGSGAAPLAASSGSTGKAAPNLPKAGSGRGAYYKDDGPGDNPPPGLELTLDAEPKVEPYLTNAANKPYVVFGKTYTPILDDRPFTERGIGSWYGKKFHGQKTSSGELYDMYKMTAAHPTLPIPSYARVTNLSNGKQVIVRINDRGPFHTSRILDLSYTAALKLDYLSKGSSELLLERLLPSDIEKMAENRKNAVPAPAPAASPDTAVAVATPIAPVPVTTVVPLAKVAQDTAGFEALVASGAPTPAPEPVPVSIQPEAQPAVPAPPPVTGEPNPASGFYVQFGAFGLRSNAEHTFQHLQATLAQLPGFEIVQQGALYRLFSGPFASRDDANQVVQLALKAGLPKPVVVQR